MAQIGKWAFTVGLVIAIVGGLGFGQTWFAWLLVLLGLIVGFLNVTDREAQKFLLAAIGLIVAATAWGLLPYVGGYLSAILNNVVAFIGAAVVVVALKVLFETAQD
jgi:hypothetical protein